VCVISNSSPQTRTSRSCSRGASPGLKANSLRSVQRQLRHVFASKRTAERLTRCFAQIIIGGLTLPPLRPSA
jgi:hypothetical protein